jgi:catechol 2,3-dioxygenase-like lactoylglutathione lyase family enzyme
MTYPHAFSHIGLSVTDLDQAVAFYTEVLGCYLLMKPTVIVAHGGKQRSHINEYFPGEKPYKMVYCEDPFGNILEVYTHSYELTYSAGAYA